MQAERISVKELPREDWLQLRKTGIGGSDAGACMLMSGWASPLSVWAEKRGLLPDKETNEDMAFGTLMEPVIRDWYKGQLKAEGIEARVEKPGFMYRSERWPWAIVNLDGRIYTQAGSGVLEIKVADRSLASKWGTDEVPDGYFCQVQHAMAVMGDEWAEIVCLLGRKFIRRRVPRNEEFIAEMMEAESALWQMVQSGDMPAPSGFDADDEALSALYAGGGDTVMLDSLEDSLARHVALKAEIKEREEERKEIGQRIKVAMGNATKGISPGFYANWSRFPMKRLDGTALKKDLPEIAAKYTKESQGERFVVAVKGKKAKEAED